MVIFKRSSKKGIEEMEPKEAFTVIEKHHNDPDFVILDVRSPEEYEKEHLEGARLLEVKKNSLEAELMKLDKEKEYFVYCRAGRRSLKAAELMKKHGIMNVVNITGGISKWKSKRLPVTTD